LISKLTTSSESQQVDISNDVQYRPSGYLIKFSHTNRIPSFVGDAMANSILTN